MIKVDRLAKRFPLDKVRRPIAIGEPVDSRQENGGFNAVVDVSFECAAGEVLGLLGANGAGKTTVLRMLSTAIKPTSGAIVIDGVDCVREPVYAQRHIGFLSGVAGLYERMSSRENIMYYGRLYGMSNPKAAERAEELLAQLDMQTFADKPIGQLSVGMKQRCAIARSIVHKPSIVIFDEPTTGLDVMSAREVLNFIQRFKEKRVPVIFSTHNLHEVEKLCDKVAFVEGGRSVFNGSLEGFMNTTPNGKLYDAFIHHAQGELQ